MAKRVIKLRGHAATQAWLPAALLRDLLDVLVEGTKRVLRLRVEGRSTAPGAAPAWLDHAAAFNVLGFRAGSTEVMLDVPQLVTAAPTLFQQDDLSELQEQDYSLDLLEESLEAAATGPEDGDLYDAGLLETFADFESVFRRGIIDLSFQNGRSFSLTPAHAARVRALAAQIPQSRPIRMSGRLNWAMHGHRRFSIQTNTALVECVQEASIEDHQMLHLFGKQVTVSGVAHFRPSGSLRRLDAEHLRSFDPEAMNPEPVTSNPPPPALAEKW